MTIQIKVVEIAKKIIDFDKKQKGRERPSHLAMRIKILTLKQMSQRLPLALVQIKAANTSEKLLNKIRQIRYYFVMRKKVIKKV